MRIRFKSYPINSNATIPRRSNRRCVPNIFESEIRTIEEVVPMADRTMEELLQAPMEGYGEAIVISKILAKNFEIKTNLLQLVQTNKFHGFERYNPHTHISNFKRMTSTLKYRDVPNDAIKLMLFTYSLEGAARIWDSTSKTDDRIDKLADQISNLVEIVNKQVITPATAKAVERTCVICEGAHAYYDCIATDSNQPSVCVATGTYNQVSLPNRASNQIPPPDFAPVQNNPNRGDFNKQEENLRRNLNNDMRSILGSFFQNQASTSSTFPSNTVPNPNGEMKAVTTRSGLAYEGPSIPTNSPLEKVVERDTEETTDKEHSNCQGSIVHIQSLVVPISILEPDVPKTQPKPNIPYPSRLNDQKLHEKATNQMEKFFQIFHDLHFDISFADAFLLMPKFSSNIKSLLTNKDKLFELAKVPLNENCSAMLLKKLPEKLGDPGKFLIPCDFSGIDVCHALADLGVSKDVFVKVGKFHFPTDFVVIDFEADPRVPLVLRRSFLRTSRALINVYGKEIILRVNDESVTFNLHQTTKYSLTYDDTSVNRVNVIDIAWYFQIMIDPQDQEKTTFICPYGTFAYRRMPFGLCNAPGHKISKSRIKVDRAKVVVIAKLPHPTTVKGVRSFLGHAGFYGRFIQDFSKIARPMTHLREKEKPFVFSKECVDAFDTLKKKLTEASILVVPDWNLPFELMCDASDFAIGAVLGQRKTKHFQPIHYASKTMSEAQIHYTTTEKEMLVVVYAFEKFWPYLVLSKSIVYTDHLALKYLLKKQDAKPRLLRWVLLLQEFNITIRDKKGSENLAADHLSRLENPHKDVLENKDINENFPLETLGSLSSSSTPWFANIANFHARNFIKKGLTSQQKNKFFKDTNGQVKVSNRGLKRILEKTVEENRVLWSDKLDDALWAFRTAFKTPIGCTPYKLVYRKSCHLPIELEHRAYWALKHVNFDLKTTGDHRKLQLNELNELRDKAYENSLIYKETIKKLHDSKIKNRIFNVGTFTITQVFPYGTVELSQPNGPNFKVNGHRVKHYFGGDIPSKVVPDLRTFPMDK
nr:hypothetical protein [Tanacetum cinerariifolium]